MNSKSLRLTVPQEKGMNISSKFARRMKRSAEDEESGSPLVIVLETQEEIDDFRAAVMHFAKTVERDIQHEEGFDPEHFAGIIRDFEESMTECDAKLEKSWFSALVKVGENGDVVTLTDKKSQKVRKRDGEGPQVVCHNV